MKEWRDQQHAITVISGQCFWAPYHNPTLKI